MIRVDWQKHIFYNIKHKYYMYNIELFCIISSISENVDSCKLLFPMWSCDVWRTCMIINAFNSGNISWRYVNSGNISWRYVNSGSICWRYVNSGNISWRYVNSGNYTLEIREFREYILEIRKFREYIPEIRQLIIFTGY